MSFSVIYGNGALMGFTPEQVSRMDLWHYTSAFAAWARFNGIKSAKLDNSLTLERLHELGIE